MILQMVIGFNSDTQSVEISLPDDETKPKTWEMVLAMLELAKLKAHDNRAFAQAVQQQQAMRERARGIEEAKAIKKLATC